MTIVPREVERQLLLELGETVGNQDQPSGALRLHGSDTPLDNRKASVLANRTEPVRDASPPTPPPESLLSELRALVREEMFGRLADPP